MTQEKLMATNFVIWMQNEGWTRVYSESLKKTAYVNSNKVCIYTFGNDDYFTKLISKHGIDLYNLYDLFVNRPDDVVTCG